MALRQVPCAVANEPVRARCGIALVLATAVATSGCAGPPLDRADAAAQISARLPGAAVEVVDVEEAESHRIVVADASGESLRFAFQRLEDAWQIDRFVNESGELVDLEQGTEAWRELLRTPRPTTLEGLATEGRPGAPLEIEVTGLRVASISATTLEMVDASGSQPLPVRIEGSNLDRLPLGPGLEVTIQVGDLERGDDAWRPIRPETSAEVLPLLEQLDVVLLQMLKIRHAGGAVPVPYR